MTSKPAGYTTPEWMRALADAVEGGDGVPYQPIHPPTLRDWADEIERLRAALKGIGWMGHDIPAAFKGPESDWQTRRARAMQRISRNAMRGEV